MKLDWKKILLCLAVPLAVGTLAALLSGGMASYETLSQPPFSPPGWLFPVVWTVLYLLMGYASWLILSSGASSDAKRRALILYGAQLLANFLWPILFFGLQWRLTALLWLVVLWVLILMTLRAFTKILERAGDLLLPYLLWVTFAGYLNLGTFLLN